VQKTLWKYCKAYGPVLLWAAVIFILSAQSSLPGFDVDLYDYIFKKTSHMFVYGVLYALLFRAINIEKKTYLNWQLPFLLCLGYAILDEFHQIFTPSRHPSPIDVGYDMLGTTIAFLRVYRYI
jgi:VanZ family protein